MSNRPPPQVGFDLPSVRDQESRLRSLFPHLQYAPRLRSSGYPSTHDIDGVLVVPKFSKVSQNYFQALLNVISMIRNSRGIVLDMACDGKLEVQKFQRVSESATSLKRLFSDSGAVLAEVPVQFTQCFVDADPEYSRNNLHNGEFSLDLFSVGVALLTCDSLWELSRTHAIVAGGDRYDNGYLQFVFGGAEGAWNLSGYELSPCAYHPQDRTPLVFPTGFCS